MRAARLRNLRGGDLEELVKMTFAKGAQGDKLDEKALEALVRAAVALNTSRDA